MQNSYFEEINKKKIKGIKTSLSHYILEFNKSYPDTGDIGVIAR